MVTIVTVRTNTRNTLCMRTNTARNAHYTVHDVRNNAASEVLSKLGVSAGDKSRELLHLARQNYKTSLKKQVWADKFIAIFSSQAAYSDLATLLRGDTSTAGVANIAISSTNCCEITPTLFIPRSNDMILYWTRTVQVFILNLSIFTLELCLVCTTHNQH